MWWLLLHAIANDLGRHDQPIKEVRYTKVEGDGPAVGKWRNSRGPFLAWQFPDGQIEHVETWDGKVRTTTRSFGSDGRPEATVDWATGRVTVHFAPPVVVDTSGWVELVVGGLSLRAPPTLLAAGDRVWSGGGLSVALQPAADPFIDTFQAEVAATCGCAIEARRTAWIAGHPGLHLRLERPDRTADLFAVPLADGLLVLASSADGSAGLGPLRAMMAMAGEAPR